MCEATTIGKAAGIGTQNAAFVAAAQERAKFVAACQERVRFILNTSEIPDVLGTLKARWKDEAAYEDFAEYQKALGAACERDGIELLNLGRNFVAKIKVPVGSGFFRADLTMNLSSCRAKIANAVLSPAIGGAA